MRHYTHANYKFNDTGWFDDKRAHLWVVDVATGARDADHLRRRLERHRSAVVARRPHASRSSPTAPARRSTTSHNTDVWVIDADGGPLTKISDHAQRRQLAALVARRPDDRLPQLGAGEVASEDLARAGAGGGASTLAADGVDLIPGGAALGRGRQARCYFETGVKGTTQLFRVDLAARKRRAGDLRRARRCTSSTSTRRPAGWPTPSTIRRTSTICTSPIWTAANETAAHASERGALDAAAARRRSSALPFKGADGWDVDGFLVKPVGWEPGKKYPMMLSIHGGPAGQYGVDWYHEFQVYAAHGWAVFFTQSARLDRLRREVRARHRAATGAARTTSTS